MDNKNQEANISKIFSVITYVVAFLLPVFYLPLTNEFFEFNKLALLIVSAMLMLILWGVRVVFTKKLRIVTSKMDVALIVFFIVTVIASLFSIDKASSIYGSENKWFPSIISISALIVLYFSLSSNLESENVIKTALKFLVGGISLSSLVAMLSYFGIYISDKAYAATPNFNLAGSTQTAAIAAAIAFVISLTFLIYKKIRFFIRPNVIA